MVANKVILLFLTANQVSVVLLRNWFSSYAGRNHIDKYKLGSAKSVSKKGACFVESSAKPVSEKEFLLRVQFYSCGVSDKKEILYYRFTIKNLYLRSFFIDQDGFYIVCMTF